MFRICLYTVMTFLVSCAVDGGEETVVKGRLYDFYTFEEIKNVEVELVQEKMEFCFSCPPPLTAYKVKTDSTGFFRIEFTTEKKMKYWLVVSPTEKYVFSFNQPIEEGKEIFYPFLLKPWGYLPVKVITPPELFGKKLHLMSSANVQTKPTEAFRSILSSSVFLLNKAETTIQVKAIPDYNLILNHSIHDSSANISLYSNNNNSKFLWIRRHKNDTFSIRLK